MPANSCPGFLSAHEYDPIAAPSRTTRSHSGVSRQKSRPIVCAETSPAKDDGPQTLSICLFSPFRVLRNGRRVDHLLGSKAIQLLKLLATTRSKCLPKEMLMEMIWPQNTPAAAATSLKVAAHNLRHGLDPDTQRGSLVNWVIAYKGTYRLNPDADIWIDAELFQAHYAEGRSLLAADSTAAARIEFEKAEGLFQSDYLEEDIYEDWTVVRREELRDLYFDILAKLATIAMEQEVHEDVIRYCHKIVLADPCREDAYRMLMRSHAALNQIARAGSWYAVCRSTLRREIGASPSAETTLAFENIFAERGASSKLRTA